MFSSLGAAVWTWSVPGHRWVDLDRVGREWAEQQIVGWGSQFKALIEKGNQRREAQLQWADILGRHLELQALLVKLEAIILRGPAVAELPTLELINSAQDLQPAWQDDFETLKWTLQAERKAASLK